MTQTISKFQGKYRFLSNFWMAEVVYKGHTYPSSEHAYQAAKAPDEDARAKVAAAKTPGNAKRAGRGVLLPPNWSLIRIDVMREILMDKFTRHPDLKQALLDTGNRRLEEGNTWGDVFWGVCRIKGKNHLGVLLMEIRAELRG